MIIKRTRLFSTKDDKKKKRNALIAGAGLTAGTALAIGLAVRNKNKKAAQKAAEEMARKTAKLEQTKKEIEKLKELKKQTEKLKDEVHKSLDGIEKETDYKKISSKVNDVAEKLGFDRSSSSKWDGISNRASELAKSDPDFAKQMKDILG